MLGRLEPREVSYPLVGCKLASPMGNYWAIPVKGDTCSPSTTVPLQNL